MPAPPRPGAARVRSGQRDDHRRAAARRVLGRELAADRLDEPPRHGQAEPHPGTVRLVAEPLEGLEDPLAVRRRYARAPVDHPDVEVVARPHPPRSAPVCPRAPTRSAFGTRFDERPLDERRIGVDPRERLGHVELDRRGAAPRRRGSRARPARSPPAPTAKRRTSTAPARNRLMSSRFSTRPVSRSVSSTIADANASTASADQSTSVASSDDAEALIEASGVRRSWDTAARSALRSSSAWPSSAATSAWRVSRRASTAAPSWVAKARITCRSSAAMLAPLQRQHHAVADGHRLGGLLRRRWARRPRPLASTRQPPAGPVPSHSTLTACERERVAQVFHQRGERIDARRRRRRGGPGSRPRPATGWPRSIAGPPRETNDDTTSPTRMNTASATTLSRVADGPRVHAAGRRTSSRTATS